MNSFTSSSKRVRRRFGWGFVGFVLLFVMAELLVFRNPAFYAKEHRSSVGQFAEIELSFQHSEPERITTAILGDSQGIDALRPGIMAASAGRDPLTIFNFSISGGKAYDIYHTYLQYADRMPSLKEAIIVVNEHQINSFNIANDIKFRYYAGLKERLQIMNGDNYGELLLGWVSKAIDMRSVWSKMFDSYTKGTLPKSIKWKPGGLKANLTVEPEFRTTEWANETADRWFEEYDPTGYQTASFESLLKVLRERGVRIVIIQLPRSSEFEMAVQNKHAAEQKTYLDTIENLAARYGATFTVMSNEGLTLKEHFRDINHPNPKGAALISRKVAVRWLK